ncbi:glycosyltransferase family 4 protein [Oceanicaulis alexandrii]|uniref:glycosyltransferase family 4 protein n=1 Tax=Oceanicaulis alexandrii TaxID=153233 RepID=UPI00235211B6|nr:glycosyltransferase family 4 protein [Oceanicaulis alexandrii]
MNDIRPRKLGYLIARFPWRSETFVWREVDNLLKRGNDMAIYAFQPPPDRDLLDEAAQTLIDRTQYISRQDAMRALLRPELLPHVAAAVKLSRSATVRANPLLLLGRASALCQRLKADGVGHLHAHWPYASQVAWLTHRIGGPSWSMSVHAHEVVHENGHFPTVYGSVDWATFCNGAAMTRLEQDLGEAGRCNHLIYHGVDLDRFTFTSAPPADGAIRLVSAGRLTPTKGFDQLIRSVAAARQAGLDASAAILGDGPEGDNLRALARELGVQDHITFAGWVRQSRVIAELEGAHAFVLLANTDFHDGLPNVVLEAMAVGRPAIISPLPAAREAIEPGVEGYVLQAKEDREGFVAAVRDLAAHPGTAARMGEAARRRIERDFGADRLIGELETRLKASLA